MAKQDETEQQKAAAEARAATRDSQDSNDEAARSEAAEGQGKRKKPDYVAPGGDYSVIDPHGGQDPGDKGVEGYTQMPYDYR